MCKACNTRTSKYLLHKNIHSFPNSSPVTATIQIILLLLVMSETASFVDPVFLARFGLYVVCISSWVTLVSVLVVRLKSIPDGRSQRFMICALKFSRKCSRLLPPSLKSISDSVEHKQRGPGNARHCDWNVDAIRAPW